MQVNSTNSVNFTSVVPIKIYNNGEIVTNPKIAKKACESITKVLAGPAKTQEQFDFLKKFAQCDPEFNLIRTIKGYCSKGQTPCMYFKIIFDKFSNPFIFTGKDADILSALGVKVGIAKRECNLNHVQDSFNLRMAKQNYCDAVQNILTDNSRYVKEGYDTSTKVKSGELTSICADIDVKARKADPEKFDLKINNLNVKKLYAPY